MKLLVLNLTVNFDFFGVLDSETVPVNDLFAGAGFLCACTNAEISSAKKRMDFFIQRLNRVQKLFK